MRTSFSLLAAALLVPAAVVAQTSSPALDDAAIVGIFDAANGWDISTGALAAKNASRSDIRDYGEMLATVHKAVQQQGRDLANKLGVKPTPVAKDFPLLVQHNDIMKRLGTLKGAAFDRAFLEHEIAYHNAVLDAVTTTFLPAIQNAELKKFVESLGPAFQAHMVKAQELLKSIR
jgi:putative membrane protein